MYLCNPNILSTKTEHTGNDIRGSTIYSRVVQLNSFFGTQQKHISMFKSYGVDLAK